MIRLDVVWCIAVKVVHDSNVHVILNVYTHYQCYKHEDKYPNRLAFISSSITDCTYTSVIVVGDMDADISDKSSLFGQFNQVL